MKKASKPASASKPAPKQPATKLSERAKSPPIGPPKREALGSGAKPLAAKPKAAAKSSPKPKPRVAEGQAELAQVVAQLALSAEKLAQAADRLAEATVTKLQERHERQDEMLKRLSESITERTASEEHPEVADAPDLTAPEGANATDSTALEEYPGIPEPSEDE